MLPLLVTSGLLCQRDPAGQAEDALLALISPRLASAEAEDVAWGAHLASRYELKRVRRALSDALSRWRDVDGEPARQVRLHLVDALWAIRARVPGDQIAPLLEDPLTRVPAFLLLTLDVRPNADLLAQLAMSSRVPFDAVPHAAGGLLVDAANQRRGVRPPALARHLLDVAACALTVNVVDGPKEEQNLWNSAVSGDDPPGLDMAPGFPPLVLHTLSRQDLAHWSGDGRVVRRGHPADASLQRTERGQTTTLPLPPGGRRQDVGVVHQRALVNVIPGRALALGEPQRHPVGQQAALWLERMALHPTPTSVTLDLPWQGETELRRVIATTCEELRQGAAPLRARLADQGWLPAAEGGDYLLPIRISVWDLRRDTATPLPKIDDDVR